MLRSTVLLVLAAALAASSPWLAWGEKSVVYEECRLVVEEGRVCAVHEVHAFYDPTFLRGETVSYEVVEGEAGEAGSSRFWRSYDDPAQGEADWWRSPLLPWARPLLLAAAVAASVAAGAGWLGLRRWTAHAAWVPLGSAVLFAAATLTSLGGVVLHAAGWTATYVEPLRPTVGTWVLAAAGLAGVAGGLRMHVVLRERAEGLTGASPLVPADDLYGFSRPEEEEEEEEEEPEAPPGRPLRWPAGGGFALATMLLLLLPLGLPLATKDIVLRDCVDDPERGSVCSREPLDVTYHAGHATVVGADGLQDRGYFGDFQEAHGGSSWMGAGAVVSVAGGAVLLAWLAAAVLGRGAGRLHAVGSLLLAAGFLLSVLGVAVQAGSWVGAPAHASRPAGGLFVGALGLLLLAARAVRLRRSASGTATTTSRAG